MPIHSREIQRVLLSEETIRRRVVELGRQITEDYRGKHPLLVGVLRGALVFLADLIRHVDLNLKVDFLAVSSYGAETISTGKIRLTRDVDSDLQNEDVILVEDIVDTGITLSCLLKHLSRQGPASLSVCSLLSKPSRRRLDVSIDYLGFEIPDAFVVGYGLDYDQMYRNLSYIGVLDESRIANGQGDRDLQASSIAE